MVLELNAPPANTYSYEMMKQLDAHVLDARMDESVHVLVLTGAGEKFFCAGADIKMLQSADPFTDADAIERAQNLARANPKYILADEIADCDWAAQKLGDLWALVNASKRDGVMAL